MKQEHTLLIGCNSFPRAKEYARLQTSHEEGLYGDIEHYYRAAGLLNPTDSILRRGIPPSGPFPFRAPHYSVSKQGVTGELVDGWRLRPGELHLAHGGTLVLDDVDSLIDEVLDTVLRAAESKTLRMSPNMVTPTDFTLVAMAAEDGPRLEEVKKLCRVVHLDVAGNEIVKS